MLVLKRKVGEVVKVGNDIELHVLAIEGEIIKLGFEAPKHIRILRSEVYDAIRAENIESNISSSKDAEEILKKLKFKGN